MIHILKIKEKNHCHCYLLCGDRTLRQPYEQPKTALFTVLNSLNVILG